MVHQSSTDPNSLLHPPTKLHISCYVKHLAKQLNTSSSLNTSPEKLLETQKLWHSLTVGSETASVPVVTMEPAIVNPPEPALSTPLTPDSIKTIVESILESQQPEQKSRQTKTCLASSQSRREGRRRHVLLVASPSLDMRLMDPPSTFSTSKGLCAIFIVQRRCFKVMLPGDSLFQKWRLKNFQGLNSFRRSWMPSRNGWIRKKTQPQHAGRLYRFCHMDLKQGPNSPHIHTGFP